MSEGALEDPGDALDALASELRSERTVISPRVVDPPSDERPAIGLLVAGGERATEAPGEYAVLIESIREGYLLHYGTPRVVSGADRDLALLAGDYLFARGLERLAALGDLEAVRELSDLIELCAQAHAERHPPAEATRVAAGLWLLCALAVASGPDATVERGKAAARDGGPEAASILAESIEQRAPSGELARRLEDAAETVGWPSFHRG